jgi:hypothetical protein
MKILLINSHNGYMSDGKQSAYLIDICPNIDTNKLKEINEKQKAAGRFGTNINEFMDDLTADGFKVKAISRGLLHDYLGIEALQYKVIAGNY